jgi:hypothetical protein
MGSIRRLQYTQQMLWIRIPCSQSSQTASDISTIPDIQSINSHDDGLTEVAMETFFPYGHRRVPGAIRSHLPSE